MKRTVYIEDSLIVFGLLHGIDSLVYHPKYASKEQRLINVLLT